MSRIEQESLLRKRRRRLREHNDLVDSGRFDRLPTPEVHSGDFVAVRRNNLIHNIYSVDDDQVTVGFDRGKRQVRRVMPIKDIKDAESYQNELLKNRGLQDAYRVTVEGNTAYLWDKTRDN
jgi:hypothetical protein